MEDTQTTETRPRFWEQAFLEALAATGIVTEAAKLAGVTRMTVWRRRTTSADFAKAYDDAHEQAMDALEAEAKRRAVDGVQEPVFYKGEVCGYVTRYSDRMLELLLKGGRPEKYRERFTLDARDIDRLIEAELQKARENLSDEDTPDSENDRVN